MNAIEERWLDYAWDVVSADDHTHACLAAGGGCLEPGGSPDLRWPGYLGSRYGVGGLLLVGNVHRDFASNHVPAGVGKQLVDATQTWRADRHTRKHYLARTRHAYELGLAGTPQWKVSTPFGYILRRLGLRWDQVCFTNASKSQLMQSSSRLPAVVQGCLERFPLDVLARDVLRSHAVVTCSPLAERALGTKAIRVSRFPQQGWSYARLDEIADEVRPLLSP